MDEKQLKQLQFFSQTHRALHAQRLKLELTIVIAALTLYVLIPGAVREMNLHSIPYWLFVVPAALVALFLVPISRANVFNQTTAETAEGLIRDNLATKGLIVYQRGDHPNRWRWLGEVIVVIFAAVVSAALTARVVDQNVQDEERNRSKRVYLEETALRVKTLEQQMEADRKRLEQLERKLSPTRSTKAAGGKRD